MVLEIIKDKNILYSFFAKNKCLFSYQIGDLDDFFFKDSDYFALVEPQTQKLLEVIVLYKGLNTPTLLVFGITKNLHLLLDLVKDFLPEMFFCHYLPEYEKFFLTHFDMEDLGMHQKMFLAIESSSHQVDSSAIIKLGKNNKKELEDFFKDAYPDTYFEPYMLDTGYYYGLLNNQSKIISVAGVHTYSKEFKLAVLGNIATHPDYRGRGNSYQLVSYLLATLKESSEFISLNVKADNLNAIKLYETLGFRKCINYKEALFIKKGN